MGTVSADGTRKFAKRFDGRADAYSRYRPRYPPEIIQKLEDEIGFDKDAIVADVGSGTGILSEIFLKNGNTVYGVEPNIGMRRAAEKSLEAYLPRFVSVDGTAEATGLSDTSVDLVAIGQALHWFDLKKARAEFKRILKKNGYVLIVYNWRKEEPGANEAYARLTRRFSKNMPDVPDINRAYIRKFLKNARYRSFVIPNHQALDLKGLMGRLASASYAPPQWSPRWVKLEKEIKATFDKYNEDGVYTIHYHTTFFLGRLA